MLLEGAACKLPSAACQTWRPPKKTGAPVERKRHPLHPLRLDLDSAGGGDGLLLRHQSHGATGGATSGAKALIFDLHRPLVAPDPRHPRHPRRRGWSKNPPRTPAAL